MFISYSTPAAVGKEFSISQQKIFLTNIRYCNAYVEFLLNYLTVQRAARTVCNASLQITTCFPAEYICYYVFLVILTMNTKYVSHHHNWPIYVMRTLDVSCNAGNQLFTRYLGKNYRPYLKNHQNTSPKLSISLFSNYELCCAMCVLLFLL